MTKLKYLLLICTAGIGLSLSGCANVSPGSDPVIVHAEQTIKIGTDTFDTFLQTEAETHQALCNVSQSVCGPVHAFAEDLRTKETYVDSTGTTIHSRKAKHWLETATNLTEAYMRSPTPDNKVNLQKILDTINAAVREATTYLGSSYIGKVKGK